MQLRIHAEDYCNLFSLFYRAAQLFSNKKNGKAVHEIRESEAITPQGNTQGLSFGTLNKMLNEMLLVLKINLDTTT